MGYHAWVRCIDCGTERWMPMPYGRPRSPRCRACAAKHRIGAKPGGEFWPTGKLADAPKLTPRRAWVSLLAREITPEDFANVLRAWEAA